MYSVTPVYDFKLYTTNQLIVDLCFSAFQPFCDNSHRKLHEADADPAKVQFRSYKFQVDKKKEYFLCMCKQTLNRPFCDGTHKKKEIQDTVLPTAWSSLILSTLFLLFQVLQTD